MPPSRVANTGGGTPAPAVKEAKRGVKGLDLLCKSASILGHEQGVTTEC
jgi:hypothetical protein